MYRSSFILLVAVLLFTAACGAPAAAPLPPTATADPLPLTYTSVNGALTVHYPRGWVIEEQGALVGLANNDAAMRSVVGQQSMASGQVGILLTAFSPTTAAAIVEQNGLEVETPTPADLIGIIAANVTTGTPGAVISTTINGVSVAHVTLILDSGDSIAIVVDAGGGSFALLQAATAPGELPQFQDTLLAIAGTVTFTPPNSAIPTRTPTTAP
ncbi:MAG: hypothetical protein U0694_08030 [Anaerolineae bacterium]